MTTQTADLVAANRILVRQGVLDAFGHVSVRTAPGAGTFWLSRNLAPGSVTESDLLEHDLDGRTDDPRRPYLERFIHAEIYRRRPDVMAVVHSHSPSVVPFSVVGTGLRPVLHMAGFLGGRPAPVFEISEFAGDGSDLLITSSALGAALAGALGEAPVALMRGHGSVAVGGSLREAVYRAVYTEMNAHAQSTALALGEPRYLSPAEAAAADATISGQATRAWDVWREQVGDQLPGTGQE
ncbi:MULTISPECIES: class II aldolase/adducin family protein [Streptomyces]|uniref:class II aldolase/adducin family protein n=1 Tax=Streptomyces TaxID=1883 RepID=UPI00086BC0CF|nr:class II aldolase/adducin family protein [Streptomyces sp. F-1]SFY52687.1 Decarboxylase NovR [Streptomyces sp. F-1]